MASFVSPVPSHRVVRVRSKGAIRFLSAQRPAFTTIFAAYPSGSEISEIMVDVVMCPIVDLTDTRLIGCVPGLLGFLREGILFRFLLRGILK